MPTARQDWSPYLGVGLGDVGELCKDRKKQEEGSLLSSVPPQRKQSLLRSYRYVLHNSRGHCLDPRQGISVCFGATSR